jgi:N-acyl-phosphatidylethanolamine-hydrolysing phospholipase D
MPEHGAGEIQRSSSSERMHHAPDGTYRNPWLDGQVRRFSSVLRWWWQRTFRGVPADPDPAAFPLGTPAFRNPRAPAGVLTVTWIGHATMLLQIGGRNVLTDPVFGERASPVGFAGPRRWVAPGVALDALPPIDAVVVSHNHYDHLQMESVRGLAARFPAASWLVPCGLKPLLRRGGATEVLELDWWESARIDGLTITATPAQHFSGRGFTDRNHTLWCGFAVSGGGCRVFFPGDTAYHPEFSLIGERCGPFDLALFPIGAYEPRWFMRPMHLDPDEAVRAFVDIGGKAAGVFGAIHWGTFKLSDEPMDEPPRRARAAWDGAGLPHRRLWVPRHGETLELALGGDLGRS